MRVAYQGERGAYSEEALIQRFGSSAEPVPKPYLSDVFDAVEAGEADAGLIPVENSLEGSVVRSYDLLYERELKARGEVVLRVRHCLIANPGVPIGDVEKVCSHPQALGQCRAYLEEHGLEAIAAYDTAGSVRMLKELGLRDSAAIASSRAAEIYGMSVLARDLETNAENYTRFLVVALKDHPPTDDDKTSIAFKLENEPGTLCGALELFAEEGINLTKIESRPQIGKPWEYVFFVDVQGHREDTGMRNALSRLVESSSSVKVLGSYPRAR
ncbi:MAG: prephenate dehydratase [Candidatus Bathyarchaeota archaeon]|nr:prephenate dehydratase [Candidatus Bathyarchaeota archaeon]